MTYFILVPMVYLAFGVFFLGILFRLISILRHPANPTTLNIFPRKRPAWAWVLYDTFLFPHVRRHKPFFWVFLVLFHVSLLLLVVGHLELIVDIDMFQVIPHNIFIGKGFVGLTLVVCLLYFFGRRLIAPVRELSVPEDYYLLLLLFVTVLFGSQMDWARTWYSYDLLDIMEYREYLVSLLTLHPHLPDPIVDSGHSFLLLVHVFCANIFLMVFPFSQLMHSILALPLNKLRRG